MDDNIPAKNQLNGVYVNCEICGKEVYKTQYLYRHRKHHFCSQECSAMFHHISHSKESVCEFCGKTFITRKAVQQRFCSTSCQNKWQKTNVGERNARYTSVKHHCDYCGKEHIIKPYKLNQKNIFCSKECRQAWFANIWSQQPEWKEESRDRAVKILSSGVISQTNSSTQILVDELLDDMGIHYIREMPFSKFCIDNYLDDSGLLIEVMGDYWHANPIKYQTLKYKHQIDTVGRDRRKIAYIQQTCGKHILYLWEDDINHSIDLCRCLIDLYINNQGVLENYNSFNYTYSNGVIAVKADIITPYQELTDNELKTYISNA